MLSTAWKPRPRNAFAEGGRAMLGQAAYGSLLNFFIEFSTDINRTIRRGEEEDELTTPRFRGQVSLVYAR
jgi:hypothetical protein